ncbi:DUF3861 domain-containing protein [Neptuniibacter sp. 1_MG-2023]|uniref:DUF3861 domain-containing protein n=1 Tax=Neptuniibacter sp. 1_MG-2023 TaxID=3062662 RepID=UPI0026E221F7|nr:DUF3861 domain-containing protein [Neptuniibacter sp. 1_MG-2023]MDO6593749.1 DUF3861 domain-containing protein [Neptuniibacter sp. 1_MG-2023]
MKKQHLYKVNIEHLKNADGSVPEDSSLAFEFSSHDELFTIIEKLKARTDIGPAKAAPLTLGIKLFGGLMLANKNDDLFVSLFPHFSAFMKKIKQKTH